MLQHDHFQRPLRRLASPRELVRQFAPNWFTATIGTGILALALNQLPVPSPGLHAMAVGIWLFDIVLFALFSALYLARWAFFFDGARRIFGHSVMSMFFGAIPMGLATIVNGFITFGPPLLGPAAFAVAQVLWWLDVAMARAFPFLMFTRQEHSIEKMTAAWLLPIVAAEVAAASGAQLIPHVAGAHAAFRLLILNYALWACSMPLALSILVIMVLHLVLHKLPHKDMAASSCARADWHRGAGSAAAGPGRARGAGPGRQGRVRANGAGHRPDRRHHAAGLRGLVAAAGHDG